MKTIWLIFSSIIILFSISLAVEGEAVNLNKKYQFINDIYSDSWALIIGINKYEKVQMYRMNWTDNIQLINNN